MYRHEGLYLRLWLSVSVLFYLLRAPWLVYVSIWKVTGKSREIHRDTYRKPTGTNHRKATGTQRTGHCSLNWFHTADFTGFWIWSYFSILRLKLKDKIHAAFFLGAHAHAHDARWGFVSRSITDTSLWSPMHLIFSSELHWSVAFSTDALASANDWINANQFIFPFLKRSELGYRRLWRIVAGQYKTWTWTASVTWTFILHTSDVKKHLYNVIILLANGKEVLCHFWV